MLEGSPRFRPPPEAEHHIARTTRSGLNSTATDCASSLEKPETRAGERWNHDSPPLHSQFGDKGPKTVYPAYVRTNCIHRQKGNRSPELKPWEVTAPRRTKGHSCPGEYAERTWLRTVSVSPHIRAVRRGPAGLNACRPSGRSCISFWHAALPPPAPFVQHRHNDVHDLIHGPTDLRERPSPVAVRHAGAHSVVVGLRTDHDHERVDVDARRTSGRAMAHRCTTCASRHYPVISASPWCRAVDGSAEGSGGSGRNPPCLSRPQERPAT